MVSVRRSLPVLLCLGLLAPLIGPSAADPGDAEGDDETFEYAFSTIEPQRFDTSGWETVDLDNDEVIELTMPSKVSFYGYETQRLHVASNGFVGLGPYSGHVGCCDVWWIPSGDSVNGMIAGLWTNLDPTQCDSRIAVDFADDWVTVAYENVTYNGSTCAFDPLPVPLPVPFPITGGPFPDNEPPPPPKLADFSVRISPVTGVIEIHLHRADANHKSVSGIESFRGRTGTQARYTSEPLEDPVAWRFTPLGFRVGGPVPYVVTHHWDGYIECSVGISGVANQALCAQFDGNWRLRLTAAPSIREFMIAVRWNATSDFDSRLRVTSADQNYGVSNIHGTSPIVSRAISPGWGYYGNVELEIQVFATGHPSPGVAFELPLEAVVEEFHNHRAPEGWNPFGPLT